jgi:uncharacterized protein (TIGR02145 family)
LSLPEPFLTIIIYLNFFHMRKVFFLKLMLLIGVSVSMNAQVRIGGLDDPHESAVLDLNATDAANSGALGLALPRVALQSTEDVSTIVNPVVGLAVYNTTPAGNGATAVVSGIYIFTGTAWTLQAPPVIITQPKSFSWSRLYEEEGDPNGPETATIEDLTVEASGAGLTYQWYKKATNKNTADTPVATTQTYRPVVTDWGMNSYYCVVSNAYGNVKSDIADVAVGCGAKTVSGGWLKFMCHNLGASPVGADQSLDEITFDTNLTIAGGDTISSDAKGWLFQWGRIADGHQWRSSAIVEGPYHHETNVEVPPGDATYYGKFITNNAMVTAYDWRTPPFAHAWRNLNDGRYPCPTGWKVPSSSDWSTLYSFGTSYGTPDKATSNAWIWNLNGYRICPDGVTTTLFLPAAGFRRSRDGLIVDVGMSMNVWSSSATADGAYTFGGGAGLVAPGFSSHRGNANYVRCVAED